MERTFRKLRKKSYFFLILFCFLFFSCATPKYIYDDLSQSELEDARREIYVSRSDYRTPTNVSEEKVKIKINRIYNSLLPTAKKVCRRINESSNCDFWKLNFSEDEVINAYAYGEGKEQTISFTKQLVSITKNDDELAIVMAHEMAHTILDHIAEDRKNSIGGRLAGIFLGSLVGVYSGDQNLASELAQSGGELGATIGQLRYSSDQELESDRVGLEIFISAGYDFDKGKKMMLNLSDSSQMNTPYLSSHPMGPERIAHLNRTYKDNKYFYMAKNIQDEKSETITKTINESIKVDETKTLIKDEKDCSIYMNDSEKLIECMAKNIQKDCSIYLNDSEKLIECLDD